MWPPTPVAIQPHEGAKGVQLVELALESWRERRWVDVPPLSLGSSRRSQCRSEGGRACQLIPL
jgi:hypothetical protein